MVAAARRDDAGAARDVAVEAQARALLRRYGVVFRRLLCARRTARPGASWRARTEGSRRAARFAAADSCRGCRASSSRSPDAVDRLREIRRTPADGRLIVIGAADPLNLAGIVTAGDRVRAAATNRVAYLNGVPVAALEGDYLRPLAPIADAIAADVASALTGRRMPAVTSGFVGA